MGQLFNGRFPIMGFTVLRTNHTSFTVSDLDRSLEFFRDCLGFQVLSRAERDPELAARVTGIAGASIVVAYVRGPGHNLELIQYLAPESRGTITARACDTGFAHVAYDVDDLEAALAAAAPYDVLPVAEPITVDAGPNKGSKIAFVRDRDGITFEFIQGVHR